MTVYLVEFGIYERHIVAQEDRYPCARYLLAKYKKDNPYEMVCIKPVNDNEKITWPPEKVAVDV